MNSCWIPGTGWRILSILSHLIFTTLKTGCCFRDKETKVQELGKDTITGKGDLTPKLFHTFLMFPGCCNTSLGHSPQVKGLTSSIKRRLYPVTLSTTPSSSCWPPPAGSCQDLRSCAGWEGRLIFSCITRHHPLPWGKGYHGLDQVCCVFYFPV